jgi:anti-sigma regulatory factor (Ser/Thr protein kinase)
VTSTASSPPQPQVQLLPPDPSSVTQARHFADSAGGGLLSPDQRDCLKLAVSEVVSNAVKHAHSTDDIKVAVTPKDGYLCVQVTDSGPGLVPKPRATAPADDGGFGLFLVEQLTRRWGITREQERTRVWFELDFDAA